MESKSNIYPLNVFYESACPLCLAEIKSLMARDKNRLLQFTDVSAPNFANSLPNVSMNDLLEVIHAQRADGKVIKGVEVIRLAYQATGLGWIGTLTRLPVVSELAERAYRWLARHRHRFPTSVINFLLACAAVRDVASPRCGRESACESQPKIVRGALHE